MTDDRPLPRQPWETDAARESRLRSWAGSSGRLDPEQEESPAATGLQSTTPEEEEMNDTSMTELPAPALLIETDCSEHDFAFYDRTAEPSLLEVDWAEAHLADLPVVYTYHSDRSVKVWRDVEGNWWRKAGTVVVTLGYRFNIHVSHGATKEDLESFLRLIEEARAGKFLAHGWRTNRGYQNSWIFSASFLAKNPQTLERWAQAAADDATPPRIETRGQTFVIPCREVGCADYGKHHLSDDLGDPDVLHDAGLIGRDAEDPWVFVEKCDDWDGWRVVLQDGAYHLTPAEAAALASDIQWATATAQKLNGKAA